MKTVKGARLLGWKIAVWVVSMFVKVESFVVVSFLIQLGLKLAAAQRQAAKMLCGGIFVGFTSSAAN